MARDGGAVGRGGRGSVAERAPRAKAGGRPAELDSHGAVIPLVTGVRRGSRGAGPAVTSKTSLSQRSDAWSRVLVSEGHGPLGEEGSQGTEPTERRQTHCLLPSKGPGNYRSVSGAWSEGCWFLNVASSPASP